MDESKFEYAGFWIRAGASIIDIFLLMSITYPILISIYGWKYFDLKGSLIAGPADFIVSWVFPAVATIWFWTSRQATPGKMALSIRILDAKSGNFPSVAQSIGRYFGYVVASIPLCVGLLWIGFDSKKQGWHDKLAGTIVVRTKKGSVATVKVEKSDVTGNTPL